MKHSGKSLEFSRLPFMPIFVDDWLSSDAVAGFTLEQEGAYFRLLMWEWKSADCALAADESVLARLSRLESRWRKVGRPIVDRCFTKIDGRLVNERLREVWERARKKSEKSAEAARISWERRRLPLTERPPDVWQEMLAAYGHRCLRCGSTKSVQRDHVIPRYQGGEHTPQNWQPLCAHCNSSKGPDRTDYRIGRPETKLDWLPARHADAHADAAAIATARDDSEGEA